MTIQPRIYVGCLTAYNVGTLHGAWIDATQDAEDILDEIHARVLDTSPAQPAEEWTILDYEGFGPFRIDEYTDIERVANLARGIVEHGDAYAAFVEYTDNVDVEAFQEAYIGEYYSLGDFAREFYEDRHEVPEELKDYIAYDRIARDMEMGGDIWATDSDLGVHVFWNI